MASCKSEDVRLESLETVCPGGGSRRGRGDGMVNARVKSAPNERWSQGRGGRAVGAWEPVGTAPPASRGAGMPPRFTCSLE